MVSGHLQIKKGYYYMVLNIKEGGIWKGKWVATKMKAKGNKKKAEALLYRTRKLYHNEEDITGAMIPFSDYITLWLKIMRPQIAPSTCICYKRIVLDCIVPYFKEKKYSLAALKPKHIQDYYEYLTVERELSGNTVRKHHANIRKCLQGAMKKELIVSNPADKTDPPKILPYVASYYDQEQLDNLFHASNGHMIEPIVLATAYYGLRRSEVLGIKWSAINFTDKTISFQHTITMGENKKGNIIIVKRDTGKNASSIRSLPLIPQVEKMLLEQKKIQNEYRKLCGNSYSKNYSEYVFVDELGELITPNQVGYHFPKLLKDNKLPHIRFHDLRHSCASLLLKHGVPMKEIQLWLGHSTYHTTANLYAHVDSGAKKETADMISRLFCKEKSGGSAKSNKETATM